MFLIIQDPLMLQHFLQISMLTVLLQSITFPFTITFMQELLNQIVLHTNNCAQFCILKKRQLQPNFVDKQWSLDGSNNLTIQELKAYLGIIIILGINPVKQYQMAFSADPFLGNEGIQKTMTLKRFEKVSQYLHVSDRAKEPG